LNQSPPIWAIRKDQSNPYLNTNYEKLPKNQQKKIRGPENKNPKLGHTNQPNPGLGVKKNNRTELNFILL
jgi:hypothetical protein